MVYFVKCFTKIYTAQVDCVIPFNKAVDYLTDSVNCVVATHSFFKTKSFTISGDKFTIFFNKTILK